MLLEAALNSLRPRLARCARADDVWRTLAALPGVYSVAALHVEKRPGGGCRISACLRLFPGDTNATQISRHVARMLFERHGVSEFVLSTEQYCGAKPR
jgi:hypothetical protein